jgi:hypothetical protein
MRFLVYRNALGRFAGQSAAAIAPPANMAPPLIDQISSIDDRDCVDLAKAARVGREAHDLKRGLLGTCQ